HRRALEPRREGGVERGEVVDAGDEGLAQRPVHVVAARELDPVETVERILEALRADLEPTLTKDPPERDHVPDDRPIAQRPWPPRRGARVRCRGRSRSPRGTSAPTPASTRPAPRRAPAARARRAPGPSRSSPPRPAASPGRAYGGPGRTPRPGPRAARERP